LPEDINRGIETPNSIIPVATNTLPINCPRPSWSFFELEIILNPCIVVNAETEVKTIPIVLFVLLFRSFFKIVVRFK
jgi:hypothetical protein